MRTNLSLYALDRAALRELSGELKEALLDDDRAKVAGLLGLGPALAGRLASGPRAVDWFLRPEDDPQASPLFASLRRIAKARALSLAWTSDELSLEGRLRDFDILREDAAIAKLIDQLLDPARLPWFLQRPGATGGWLDVAKREQLTAGLRAVEAALPKELADFSEAVAKIEGDVIAHDRL